MKSSLISLSILFGLLFCNCTSKNKEPKTDNTTKESKAKNQIQQIDSSQVKKTDPLSEKDQILFIRAQFAEISKGIQNKKYELIEFKVEEEGTFIDYTRAQNKGKNKFLSISYCSDHGCEKTSYYFNEGKLLFKFFEKSNWFGETDELFEFRTYYMDNTSFKCLERSHKGPGGYEAISDQLQNTQQIEKTCSEKFDFASINNLLELTEENGPNYFE